MESSFSLRSDAANGHLDEDVNMLSSHPINIGMSSGVPFSFTVTQYSIESPSGPVLGFHCNSILLGSILVALLDGKDKKGVVGSWFWMTVWIVKRSRRIRLIIAKGFMN